jgi:hypothetical protein
MPAPAAIALSLACARTSRGASKNDSRVVRQGALLAPTPRGRPLSVRRTIPFADFILETFVACVLTPVAVIIECAVATGGLSRKQRGIHASVRVASCRSICRVARRNCHCQRVDCRNGR